MSEYDKLMARLEKQANQFESFEENLDPKLVAIAHHPAVQQAVMQARGENHQTPYNAGGGGGAVMTMKGIEALLDITVTRLTNTIAESLEFALFGQNQFSTKYDGIIQLSSGMTLVIDTTDPNQVDFVFTKGANTDIVRVTSSQLPYLSFLDSLASDMFQSDKIRYSLGDATQLVQFSKAIFFVNRSLFGNSGRVPLPVNSFKDPFQQQNGIIDLGTDLKPLKMKVDKNSTLVTSIIPVAGFNFTMSFFVNKLEKINRASL
jgi:hypothetical protein